MRLARLEIPAFGPFTDWRLELPGPEAGGGADLHLLLGPNEAGKSSLLRAIRQLLYGIPERSEDGFVHDYQRLRIGAELVAADGARLTVFRRKGRKETLLDADGGVLPDTVLKPFLGAVDEGYFVHMFGMGVTDLRDGAASLLQGEGELGRALFSASLGGSDVQRAIEALNGEADELFKPRGRNQRVSEALRLRREALDRSRDASVRPELWQQIETDLAAAEARRDELAERKSALQGRRDWWQRCLDALASLGQWDGLLEQLRGVEGLPEVADDFGATVSEWQKRRHELQAEEGTRRQRLKELDKQVAEVAGRLQPEWLEAAGRIDDLVGGRSRQEDQLARIEEAERLRQRSEEELRRRLSDQQLPDEVAAAGDYRIDQPRELKGREAAARLIELAEQRQRNRERMGQLAADIERRGGELEGLPAELSDDLRGALEVARPLAGLEAKLAEEGARLEELRKEQRRRREQLRPAPVAALAGDAELAAAAVPGRGVLQTWQQRFDEHRRRLQEVGRQQREQLELLERADREMDTLNRGGDLPSEEALKEARARRDVLWQQAPDRPGADGAAEWRERFAAAMAAADELADRLYEAAQAVAHAAEVRERRRQLVATCERLRVEHEELTAAHDLDVKEWRGLWQGLVEKPGDPVEMQEWREVWQPFADAVHRGDDLEASIRAGEQRLVAAAEALAAALAAGDDGGRADGRAAMPAAAAAGGFGGLLRRAENRSGEGAEAAGRRQELERGLREAAAERARLKQEWRQLEEDWSAAEQRWRVCCDELHLPADTSPQAGLTLIQERRELAQAFEGWQRVRAELDDLRQHTRAFEAAVDELAGPLAVEGGDWRERLAALRAGAERALECRREHDRLVADRRQLREALERLAPELEKNRLQLETLQQQAGVDSAEALIERLPLLQERGRLRAEQQRLRDTLNGLTRGEGFERFLERLRAEPADELAARIEAADAELGGLEQQLEDERGQVAQLQEQRRQLEQAGDAAAVAAQEAEIAAAGALEHSRRYVRLKVAVALMEQQIEDYRRQHQAPLMRNSGKWFQRITGGSFEELAGEEDRPGHVVLMGVRANGSRVPVTGMSEGTRDQLYLALRLAALEHYLEDKSHEPMPLILDDLLITFDDERAAAVLGALHELSRGTQVLLFTHHRHLLELARDTLGAEGFGCHSLDPPK